MTLLGYGGARLVALYRVTIPSPPLPLAVSAPPLRATGSAAATAWANRWERVLKQAHTPGRDRGMETLIEELARTNPERALQLALAEPNWDLRARLRDAALRGWGAVAPDAAGAWAMQRVLPAEKMQCVSAVLTGAAEKPDDAVRVGLKLCAVDGEQAGEYGHALINALAGKNGAFEAAARFAAAAGMVDRQGILLESAFRQWAHHQPEQALSHWQQITDPAVRKGAFEGLVSGWADSDPTRLAQFATALPAGEERTRAFGSAAFHWAQKDPAGAMEWVGRFDPSPELDESMKAVATMPSLIAAQPTTALEWADTITDRGQRMMAKHTVFTAWAQQNPAAAREFSRNVHDADEREMMAEVIAGLGETK